MQDELLRYSCQMALPDFSIAVQQKLLQAKVLIVGMGGLGCPAAQYLAAAGIGTLGLVDDDIVSISNLHRQVLYTPADAGQKKALIAARKLQQQNPQISIAALDLRLSSENAVSLMAAYDIIIDATDNIETKYLLNDACYLTGKSLVYGAIYQYEGHLAVWNATNTDGSRTPNYRDLFPNIDAAQLPNCADGGVIPTLAGIIGCMQANEVIKFVSGTGELLSGRLLILDAQTLQSRIIKLGIVTKIEITELTQTTHTSTISATQLKKELEQNIYHLVDVRTVAEHTTFNIGGINIPLQELEAQLTKLNSDTTIILYCSSGKRSTEAVKLIQKLAPELSVLSLEGGLNAWQQL
ncbi:MAG: HesA/MoeB/ThiF family protein [Bacteroidetes bacterium]|nr:HesA/MoeB/ThiF family protein [Bacteroidota bacterium]